LGVRDYNRVRVYLYRLKRYEVLELLAEDAVAEAVELLCSGYVLIEGSVECLATYSQLLELTGIVIKDRNALRLQRKWF